MNLRIKLLLSIGLALIAVFTLVAVFSAVSMNDSYLQLEQHEVGEAALFTSGTLDRDVQNLYSINRDYAAWNDTYTFAGGGYPYWVRQNTADDFFTRFGISDVVVLNRSGSVILARSYDESLQQAVDGVPAPVEGSILHRAAPPDIPDPPNGTSGVFDSTDGPLIITSHPILHDDLSGPAAGTLLLVRRIDDRYIAELSARAGHNVTVISDQEIAGNPSLTAIAPAVSYGSPAVVVPESADIVSGYLAAGDPEGADPYYLKITEPRAIFQNGQRTIWLFIASLSVAGIFITAFVLLVIDRVVLSRLNTIIRNVRDNPETAGRNPGGLNGKDELAQLALEISPVLSRLTESRVQLKESEERYRTLAESARDFIFIIDRQDRIAYVNSFAAESAGRSRDDLIGHMRSELFPEPENSRQHTNIVRVLAHGEPLKIESSITLLSGKRWHDTLLVPIRDRDGAVTGVMGVSRDLTERKQAEEALRQSEMRYHELFELGGEAVFLVANGTGRILEANSAASAMYGYSHAELLSMEDTDLSAEPEETKKLTASSPEDSVLIPLRFQKRKDGTVFPAEINARFFTSGTRSVHVAAVRDITLREQAQATLKESNERFRTVMDSLDAFVYVADMKTHEILFLNQTGRRVWGDVTGRRCWEFFQPGRDRPCSFCTNDRLLDGKGDPAEVVVWEIRNAVSGRWYECRDRAIRWIDGRLVRLEISTDITERKRVEEALLQVNNKLNLLSGITRHDILNQLTALTAYIELSAAHAAGNEVLMEFIRKEMLIANVIDRQIRFTRDYSKLGKMAPVWQNVADIIGWTRQSLLLRNITIRTEFSGIEIFADPLLEKVFFNLMDNALRYGGEKMTTIRFSWQESDDTLVIFCEDDGSGIADENKERIFTRGFAHNTGLGLFLSREILGITGITITESGTFGKGARFGIRVPKGSYRFNGSRKDS